MIKGRVSICIPSRNEQHLQKTVAGLLKHAAGDVEILAMLDGGPWPDPPLPNDPRLIVVRHNEPMGMRPTINEAAQIASGEYLMKCDAHCIFAEGYDEALKADCDYDWLVVPTRHSIDGVKWDSDGEEAAIKPRDYNYSILTYAFLQSMYGTGFHSVTADWKLNRAINKQRAAYPIDDILCAQGSCWFQHVDYFRSFPPLDHEILYFYQENQEVTLRVLASGGRSIVNKKTWYGHSHKGHDNKGADGRPGRGYYLDLRKKRSSEAIVADWCINGWPSAWPNATRSFVSMIEQHWWLISQMHDPRYAWPEDWRDWEKHRQAFKNRPPEQIPAHI